MFELALLQSFPNAQYYILEPNERRKHWFYDYEPTHIKSIQYSKEEMIDLGRDQTHPGPKTHEYLANKVLEEINNTGFLIEGKYGSESRTNIEDLAKVKLKRRILGD